MEVAVQELQMIIKWAKQLSTFNDLDVDDQINLLSEGRSTISYTMSFLIKSPDRCSLCCPSSTQKVFIHGVQVCILPVANPA